VVKRALKIQLLKFAIPACGRQAIFKFCNWSFEIQTLYPDERVVQ
jgi:hypothetical protein